ncbi:MULTISPECIES: pyridoxal phosphate-dependent decarboxylase family protein [Rhodanobacter]|uniref:PLP-dependent enzyme, glutamate decarboxylase n=1 Tax=Rhodanobacter denitrificans TaxID=666685 RepID=M4NGE9_9GAMM|nr:MULTISPECIES: pyridoxal-dependent decarboxylase [Rhodanobacter]AGG89959.1 PLP-dependent enzyme, glutamate decarboxylase [Rhodanobacter denitrificans]KZC20716.1 pyridoxal-dependent decarboxylase [Rhodanobacter denitrificans]UJM85355.1 pyridoxal-dependent decarboxylase [Rhodanobacter denitrificans]UJM92791.1 pyridoxal-dependent decarboxylase [Rhodanobacter denitrificans]UJM96321.1 pyridoxal-dependent decarboxylase [Rhodanobacter denitrificans]
MSAAQPFDHVEPRDHTLDACFLGPYGENDTLLEKLLVEFLRDHVYWRRNFHPEDPPAIGTGAAHHPDYLAFESRMRRELHQLSAALKKSVPFHSPRYIGHMASDLLLPGLAAQMLTLPYNPNNVSEDAAPVTVDLEVQAGLQLARMLGYPHDPAQEACAFGHLTSGGTLANYQALRLALALKAFPVALRAAGAPELALPADDWSAFNLSTADGIALLETWQHWLAAQTPAQRAHWLHRVENERIEQLGLVGFFAAHPSLRVPLVLAPVTAHYSWSKGLKLLGLGRDQLELLPTDGMRLNPAALADTLERCARERQPVLMCVAVLGGTEYGTIDPIDAVLAARQASRGRGLDFAVHVDAAWGGYLATLFRNEDGSLRTREEVAADYVQFPTPAVHAAFAALGETDSVTVDPHKLGYLPYGSGAFICRDHRAMTLLAERADYVFHAATPAGYLARYRSLGQFIPEGSKSGAAAAAVYVTHRVLPLDHAHFGALPRATVRAAETFHARAQRFALELADDVHALVPFAPDSNLVCLALNPCGNTSVAAANAFVRELHDTLRCDPHQPLQTKEFFGSVTSLRPDMLGPVQTSRIFAALGLDTASLGPDEDRLLILRHTLMNPYLIDHENGISYIDRYFDFLGRRMRMLRGGATSQT